ncbi:hypothetical protein C8J57DRAFT_1254742 [Mycena rebaudengoi]|nr:hypothetical protein C8J57DRAFT_1254742 [Mycena rebaudengoi]
MSRRFAPYPPYPRTSGLQTPASDSSPTVRAAYSSLLDRNSAGVLSTWDHIALDWRTVPRPQREQSGRLVDIAATGLRNVWSKHQSPFLCPHTDRAGNPYPPMTLHLNATYSAGQRADFYQSKDHQCRFKVLIPRLKPRSVLTSQQEIDAFKAAHSDQGSSSSDQESSSLPSSQDSSSSAAEVAASLLVNDPRRPATPPPSPFPPRPTPCGPGNMRRPPTSYFSAEVAHARALNNNDLRDYIDECQRAGIFEDAPFEHPLAAPELPQIMRTYCPKLYPSNLSRTVRHYFYKGQEFFNSPLGLAIRYLVSPLGLPWNDYSNIVDHCKGCIGCQCLFSIAGYNAHITEDGRCGNTPSMPAVARDSSARLPTFKYRTYRDRQGIDVPMQYRLNTPSGIALLEWNSRVGIPYDVWSVVSTGIVRCGACDLVRTFEGHKDHLDEAGECGDLGQDFLAPAGDNSD